MICTAVNANELFLRTNTEIARGRFFSKLFGSNSAVLRNLILVVIGGFNLFWKRNVILVDGFEIGS